MMNCKETATRTVILGTDWWTDCDDVAAIRILCRAAKAGIWNIAGVACNAVMEYSAASLSAFLTSEGFGNTPLGLDRDATDYGGLPPYQKLLAEYPHRLTSNDSPEVDDALPLYLRLLRDARSPVELIEIGYPQVLAQFCAHPDGYEYLKSKVSRIWMMAGKWDNGGVGCENNFTRSPRSRKAAAYLLEHCPCPITFLGWEVGADVISGKPDPVLLPESDMLRVAFLAHQSHGGRSSWDPMLVLLAAENDLEAAGYTAEKGFASVDPESGENSFTYSLNGLHEYVIKAHPDSYYEEKLSRWLRTE